MQHVSVSEPNVTEYTSTDRCRHLGCSPIKVLLFVCLKMSCCLSVLLPSQLLLICVAILLQGFSCSLVFQQHSAHTFCLAGTSFSTSRSSGCSAGTPYPHASKSFRTAILHTSRHCVRLYCGYSWSSCALRAWYIVSSRGTLAGKVVDVAVLHRDTTVQQQN